MKRLSLLVATLGAIGLGASANAQNILFSFDDLAAHSGLPGSYTSGGLTAHMSATGSGFSIQQAGVLGFTPVGFSGNCVYPNSVYLADLNVSFDQDITDFSIMFAPEEYACDSSATMKVTAYENGVLVGSSTAKAPHPGTWPTGTLRFNTGAKFNSVVIHYQAPPVTGGDWGPIFMADNMKATVSTVPVAVDDAYTFPINTTENINAASGVLANDTYTAGTTTVLKSTTTHGTVTLYTDGSFTYVPQAGYVGTDSFTYADTYSGQTSNTATVTINVQPALTGVSLSSSAVLNGTAITGTVTLANPAPTGGSIVALSSSVTGTSVPASVKISAGKTTGTFKFTAGTVTTATSGNITATLNGESRNASLTVYPFSNLVSIGATATTIIGGGTTKCTITLDSPVAVGSETILLSSGSANLIVPASVKVLAGKSSITFTVKSIAVDANTTEAFTASFNGVTLTETITITIPPVSSVSLSPATVVGLTSSTGTVTLKGKAGPSGVVVNLSASNGYASVPATVTIPAGSTSATFTITTAAVTTNKTVIISATYSGSTKSATLTITP